MKLSASGALSAAETLGCGRIASEITAKVFAVPRCFLAIPRANISGGHPGCLSSNESVSSSATRSAEFPSRANSDALHGSCRTTPINRRAAKARCGLPSGRFLTKAAVHRPSSLGLSASRSELRHHPDLPDAAHGKNMTENAGRRAVDGMTAGISANAFGVVAFKHAWRGSFWLDTSAAVAPHGNQTLSGYSGALRCPRWFMILASTMAATHGVTSERGAAWWPSTPIR
jgi:hypothetical protein